MFTKSIGIRGFRRTEIHEREGGDKEKNSKV